MNKHIKAILLWATLLFTLPMSAQISRISGTVSDEFGGIPGIQVKEIDTNNRIVSSAITDANGNYTMVVKNQKNKIVFHGVGYTDQTRTITKSVIHVNMKEAVKLMKEAVVTAKKLSPVAGLSIPEREYGGAVSSMKMDDLEGLAFESVDQALQGQIAGLDIVANSGSVGSGTTMRLRGFTSLSGNAQPLIVLNDHIWKIPEGTQPDINYEEMDNEEQFATLLSVNPEDIESITVLKDASATAKWGADGAPGVIEIKTRRGKPGPTQVNFSYKFTGRWQPTGYKMLNGDGYTMMQKEAFFNPTQSSSTIKEFDYNMAYPYIYNHYSHNTDWLDATRQFGREHRYYINLSGGGEKAQFRVAAGYNTSKGTVICEKFDQFTQTTALDYKVSDRIEFHANVLMSYGVTNWAYGHNIVGQAYKALPNMSIYEKDAQGNFTGNYFNMLPLAAYMSTSSLDRRENDGTMTSYELASAFTNGNPVAYANQSWWKKKQYNLTPQFDIRYKLWGKGNDDKHRLDYKGDVMLNIFNLSQDKYCPSELRNMPWYFGGDNSAKTLGSNNRNYVSNDESKSLYFETKHDLEFYSHFKNTDHSLLGSFTFKLWTETGSSQNLTLWNVPDGITDPTVVALLTGAGAGNYERRGHTFKETVHYSYKSKYSVGATLFTDGRTDFGRGYKYAHLPSVYARWNIIDEKFMTKTRNILSMLSFAPSWGLQGYTGGAGGNQYNKYNTNAGMYNRHTVITPENLSLTELRWEKAQQLNLKFDLGLLNDLLTFQLNVFNRKTTDKLTAGLRIPSINGFSTLNYTNAGTVRDKGWELEARTGRFAKVGKFSMRVNGNISQQVQVIEKMDPLILETYNDDDNWIPYNFNANRRLQVNNAMGSIYGLRYQGVYRYDYDHNGYTNASWKAYGYAEVDQNGNVFTNADDAARYGTGYDRHGNPINTAAAAARRGENSTCPVAHDANGNMLTDAKGNPLHMYYCYSDNRVAFNGGDAIYEDINHDGTIDRYDLVYLGNSNPKLFGGFGLTLTYGKLELTTYFYFRFGQKILNEARARYEGMVDFENQSYATTWRWRKNGDITEIPRALSGFGGYTSYNSLISDRYVENGDFLKWSNLQLSYKCDPKKLKKYGIRTLNVSASVHNLFCWTKYTGVDPEVGYGGYSISKDTSKAPVSKYFTCSLTLGF